MQHSSPTIPTSSTSMPSTTTTPSATSPYSGKSIQNSIIAGYAAGFCGVCLGHPLDTLKVFMQTDKRYTTNSSKPTISSLSAATTSLNKSASQVRAMSTVASAAAATPNPAPRALTLKMLYSGIACPLVTVGMVQSINFCVYDSLRRIWHKRQHPNNTHEFDYLQNDSITNVTCASMSAGSVLAFLTSPLLVIKTKQQALTCTFQQAIRQTYRQGGIRHFYTGFGPHLLSEMLGRGIYFSTYETLKRTVAPNRSATLSERMGASALSGMLCWACIFPLDVLRNRLYVSTSMKDTAWGIFTSLVAQDRGAALYRGFGVTVLRAGPVASIVLPVYDFTLEWLNTN